MTPFQRIEHVMPWVSEVSQEELLKALHDFAIMRDALKRIAYSAQLTNDYTACANLAGSTLRNLGIEP